MNKTIIALITTLPILITACDSEEGLFGSDEEPKAADVSATHINQVRTMHLSTNDCPVGIRKGLQEHGFAILADDQQADARIEVNVTRTGRNLDQVPEFGGFGAKASFTAKVIGAEGKTLFSTGGKEGSLTSEELCEDIGDELAEKLKGSPLGTVN